MNHLREIINKKITSGKDNLIFASIHNKDKRINENYIPSIHNSTDLGLFSVGKNRKKILGKIETPLVNHYKFGETEWNHQDGYHLKDYTGSSSGINTFLHEYHKDNKVKFDPYQDFHYHQSDYYKKSIRGIDKSLEKHVTPKNLTVYSGVKYDPRERMNSEGIMHHPAYLSASIEKNIAINFGYAPKYNTFKETKPTSYSYKQTGNPATEKEYWNKPYSVSKHDPEGISEFHHHILKIHVPKGSHGGYVNHISKIKDEYEFILPRGVNLKHKYETVETHPLPDFPDSKIHIHTHHMKLMNPKSNNYDPKAEKQEKIISPVKEKSKKWKNMNNLHSDLKRGFLCPYLQNYGRNYSLPYNNIKAKDIHGMEKQKNEKS